MPPIDQLPRALDFIVSEANGYRSREKVVLLQSPTPDTAIILQPGTLLYAQGAELATPVLTGYYLPVTAAGIAGPPSQINAISAILMYPTDTRDGDVEVAVIQRDAEVNDAYLLYGLSLIGGAAFDPDEVIAARAALLNNRIIVRPGVFAQSMVAPPPAP
jgi:hypothetical protein